MIDFITHLLAAMGGACVGMIAAALCMAASREDRQHR